MTLPVSGPISLSQVNTELNRSSTAIIGMNDSALRSLFGVASGAISMSDGYGKSNSGSIGTSGVFINGTDLGYTSLPLTIQVFTFSSETIATAAQSMSIGKNDSTGISSATKGYSAGGDVLNGFSRTFSTNIASVVFATNVSTNIAAVLDSARGLCSGAYGSGKGFISGGFTTYSSVRVNTIQRMTYSSEALATLAATLVSATGWAEGFSGPLAGYIAGGGDAANSGVANAILRVCGKIVYATETSSQLAATFTNRRYSGAGAMSATTGYIAGGQGGTGTSGSSYLRSIETVNFSNDTIALLGSSMGSSSSGAQAVNSTTKYYMGGAVSATNNIYSLVFATSVTATLTATLPTTQNYIDTASAQAWN